MSAKEDLAAAYGADVELVKSSGGVFEVEVDGSLVFSKRALGRFPEPDELRRLAGGGEPHPSSPPPSPGAGGGCICC